MEQILVMINDSPRVRLADDEWIAEHAVELGAQKEDEPFDFIERHYERMGKFYVMDNPREVDCFLNACKDKLSEFIITEILLIRDGWLLEEV